MPKVLFNYADRPLLLNGKKKIRLFIESNLFSTEYKTLKSLNYIFCSDEYLLKINTDFLHHDDYTDIITFDLSENEAITGEVYISVDRVKENAQVFGTAFKDEILRVIFHGALHLCGYKDKAPNEIKLMREKENTYIEQYKKSST